MIPVPLQVAIAGNCQGIGSNVKLSILVQQWLLHVLMNDVRSLPPIYVRLVYQALDMVKVSAHLDATSSVGVLAWLDNPHGGPQLGVLLQVGMIRGIVVDLCELGEFPIILTLLDVEGQRDVVKWIDTLTLIEDLHVVVDGLLVR
jgi:hypothetical protein